MPSFAEHPLRAYFDAGLVVSLCTDNRLMSATTVTDEYVRAHEHLDFSWEELKRVSEMGFEAAFLHRDEKQALLAEVKREMAGLDGEAGA